MPDPNRGGASVWCAIPVYNNGSTVRQVVEQALRVLDRVVVVDDGSTDTDPGALLAGLNVVLIRHRRNLGKGAAILSASRYIEDHGGIFMITVDADGQHNPEDIRRFLPLLDDEDRLVVGSRDFTADHVPASSRFGRRFANFWLRVESGVQVDDCQSGFRAYPVRHLNRLKIRGKRYDFEAEVLAKAAWAGLELKGVDVSVWYPRPQDRVSHFRPWMDNLRLTHRHTLLVLRRLLPVPHQRLVPRDKPDLRVLLHPVNALKSIINEHASPAGLAASAAVGILLATLPLLFVHTVAILYVTTRLNLNKLVAVNIQHLCMPPFVPALCIEIGFFLRHGRWLTDLSFKTVFEQFSDRLLEWFYGSLIVGPVLAAAVGLAVYLTASVFRRRRTVAA